MGNKLPGGIPAAESWTVSYGDEVFFDACKTDGVWVFRESTISPFKPFAIQANVVPICTNGTFTTRSENNKLQPRPKPNAAD